MTELLTGPEAAELCSVRPATIRKWVQRGRLTPAGLNDRGHPVYAQLDVALAEAATRDRARRVPATG